MSYLETNSTEAVLLANASFIGKSSKIDANFITVQISVTTDKPGTLSLYHSYDGKQFETYGDTIEIDTTSKHIQYSIKGSYIYVKYTNGNQNQTKFSLHTKLSIQSRENMNVQLNYLEDSISVPALESSLTQVGAETYQNVLLYGKNANNLVEPVKISQNRINVIDVSANEVLNKLNFDTSGNLKVTSSGGGGTSSDVNVTNSNLNVTEANSQDILDSLQSLTNNVTFNTNSALWVAVNDVLNPIQVENVPDTKLNVDISGQRVVTDISGQHVVTDISGQRVVTDISGQTVNISNQITGYATETTQQDILNTVSNPPAATLILDSPEGISAYADTFPVPTVDTYKRKGWYYTNTNATNKYNYYFYSNGNTTQTLADITGAWCVCENDTTTTTSSIVNPIISIYTVGNLNIWYQSSRVYAANVNMVAGMKYLFYWGVEPSVYPELPRVQLTLATSNGPQLPTEQILTMSVGSDSGASAGIVKNLMTHIGWRNSSNEFITELISNSKFISTDVRILDKLSTGLDISGSVSVSNFPSVQIVDVSGLVDVSGAVSVSNFPSVQVVDVSGLVDISGAVSVSNFPSVQVVDVSGLVDISGSVSVSNFPTVQVVDVSGLVDISGAVSVSNFPSVQVVDISGLVDVSGSVSVSNFPAVQIVDISGLVDVSGSVSVSNFPSVQVVDVSGLVDVSGSVSVSNFPSVQVVDVSGLVDISGAVSVSNQISGFATEITLAQIDMTLSSGSLATVSTVENKANNNLRTDLYADNGSAQEKLTSISGKLQVHNMDAKVSEITSALTTTNTYLDRNKYDASGNLKTNIENSSLDCHIYGSSNGSTWHHIKTNANGVIHTHLETVASGALTATVSSGVYNALDVSIKNSSLAVNSVNSGSWGNAVNNGSLNGNQYTSGIDISTTAYIYVIYRDGSTGVFDSIQIEFSFDNTNWYYLGDSIFPSTPQGQQYRQGTLNDKRKYGWNYMRFKNNGNSSLSSVYITILGSSI